MEHKTLKTLGFHVRMNVAQLKEEELDVEGRHLGRFPRSNERGSIEAVGSEHYPNVLDLVSTFE